MYNKFGTNVSEKTKLIERIDELLTLANRCWVAPLNTDPNTSRYSYDLLISLLETLSLEISSYLDKDELKKDSDFRDKIASTIKINPIFLHRYNDSISGKHKRIVKSDDNWILLKNILLEYDRFLRTAVNTKLKEQLYGEDADITYVDADGNIEGLNNEEQS